LLGFRAIPINYSLLKVTDFDAAWTSVIIQRTGTIETVKGATARSIVLLCRRGSVAMVVQFRHGRIVTVIGDTALTVRHDVVLAVP
jgi:hypothetical protein